MIRVAIIDDHPLYRHGLAMAVEQAEDFIVVPAAGAADDVIDAPGAAPS